MTNQLTADFLDLFAHAAFEELGAYMPCNCCIGGTKIGISVLAEFGVLAEPMSVEMVVHNPHHTAFLLNNERLPSKDECPQGLSVLIGAKSDEPAGVNDWNGHLVLLVEDRYLIDLTAAQAMVLAGEDSGIVLDAVILDLGQRIGGVENFRAAGGAAGPCLMSYKGRHENTSYVDALAWNEPRHQQPHVNRIVKAICKHGYGPGQFTTTYAGEKAEVTVSGAAN